MSRPPGESAWTRWKTPLSGVVSGLLFALAFPPHGWSVLVPLAPTVWIAALAGEPRKLRALVSGLLFGLAFWCASLPWISFVVTSYGGQSPVMGVVCVVLLALILAEWPVIVGWGVAAAGPPGSWQRFAAFPLFWAATEHVRSLAYGGFPWNLTAWALARRPVWIQTASLWGAYGLGFAAAAVSALIARAIVRRRLALLAVPAAAVLVLGIFGAASLARPAPPGRPAIVAVLQPNIAEEDRLTAEGASAGYTALIDRALAAAAQGADLIVLPESALPVSWERSPRLREDLLRVAAACRCAVLFNDVVTEPNGGVSNAAHLARPGGLAPGTYRKVHLVPFGEYVPLPRLFFFARRISQAIGEFTPAAKPVLLASPPFTLGVGICYEIIYPPLARQQTAEGANLLATISNDSWYGRGGAQEQHFAGALLRAVENGRWLVRSAITGISGVVDTKGRIVAELPANTAGTLRVAVRLETAITAWTKWGHGLPFAGDAAALTMLIWGLVRRGRAGASEREPRARRAAPDGEST